MVESLKSRVISSACQRVRMSRAQEKRARRPIDRWTHMASALSGTLEPVLSAAFSQMLIVASTEPCTLRNGYHPQVSRAPAHPPRGRDCPSEAGSSSRGGSRCPRPPRVTQDSSGEQGPSQEPPSAISSGASAQPQHVSTSAAAPPPHLELHPALCLLLPPPRTESPAPRRRSSVIPPASSPPANPVLTCPPRVPPPPPPGPAGSPPGPVDAVDFERIYSFLSAIQKPKEACPLSPMESAVVLELLMSLPEELALLDCSRLHRHLLQVYRYVSAPAHSKAAREALGALRAGLSAQVEAPAPAADHGGTSSQSGDADTLEACPPLNPFMVPVKLLMRR
ncbi:snRNA-activating protein complex subunit 2 [Menidia menidia]